MHFVVGKVSAIAFETCGDHRLGEGCVAVSWVFQRGGGMIRGALEKFQCHFARDGKSSSLTRHRACFTQ